MTAGVCLFYIRKEIKHHEKDVTLPSALVPGLPDKAKFENVSSIYNTPLKTSSCTFPAYFYSKLCVSLEVTLTAPSWNKMDLFKHA